MTSIRSHQNCAQYMICLLIRVKADKSMIFQSGPALFVPAAFPVTGVFVTIRHTCPGLIICQRIFAGPGTISLYFRTWFLHCIQIVSNISRHYLFRLAVQE